MEDIHSPFCAILGNQGVCFSVVSPYFKIPRSDQNGPKILISLTNLAIFGATRRNGPDYRYNEGFWCA